MTFSEAPAQLSLAKIIAEALCDAGRVEASRQTCLFRAT
jgi:hypothetical protein